MPYLCTIPGWAIAQVLFGGIVPDFNRLGRDQAQTSRVLTPNTAPASASRRSSVHSVSPFRTQIARCSASGARSPSVDRSRNRAAACKSKSEMERMVRLPSANCANCRECFNPLVRVEFAHALLSGQSRRELGLCPEAGREITLLLQFEPSLCAAGFRLVRQRSDHQRGVEIQAQ